MSETVRLIIYAYSKDGSGSSYPDGYIDMPSSNTEAAERKIAEQEDRIDSLEQQLMEKDTIITTWETENAAARIGKAGEK